MNTSSLLRRALAWSRRRLPASGRVRRWLTSPLMRQVNARTLADLGYPEAIFIAEEIQAAEPAVPDVRRAVEGATADHPAACGRACLRSGSSA